MGVLAVFGLPIGGVELLICGVLLFPLIALAVVAVVLLNRQPSSSSSAVATPAGWHPDPSGRHEFRYWDGVQWTAQVSDSGVASTDPL